MVGFEKGIQKMKSVDIFVVGMNHKTAPVDVRERMGISPESMEEFLYGLSEFDEISECLVLSTCNRVEILGCAEDTKRAVDSSVNYLGLFHGKRHKEINNFYYIKEGSEAVSHVFRVTSALDSMVIGEPQILGQVKDSYRAAVCARTTGIILNRLMHRSFFAAKRVRNETEISSRPVSIGSAAVCLAEDTLGDISGKSILMVGAGEIGEETIKNLFCYDVRSMSVVNRTLETASKIAEKFNAKAIPWDDLHTALVKSDIVITSTSSKDKIITKSMMNEVMKKRSKKPMAIIDIAVPRDVDHSVKEIEGISLFNIDDLDGVIKENLKMREDQAKSSEKIIGEESDKFTQWMESLDFVPTIVSLRDKFKRIGKEELKKTISTWDDITEEERKRLHRLTSSVINKILHDPTVYLKKEAPGGGGITKSFINELFGLIEGCGEENQDRDKG